MVTKPPQTPVQAPPPALSGPQTELVHLYELLHTVPIPELTQGYSLQLEEYTHTNDVALPSLLAHQVCPECGVLFIPGISATIRIRYKRRRYLEIKCRLCKHKVRDYLLVQHRPLIREEEPQAAKPKTTNKAKLRAQKRRENLLGAMLAKKEKEKKPLGIGGLDLMEFMK